MIDAMPGIEIELRQDGLIEVRRRGSVRLIRNWDDAWHMPRSENPVQKGRK